jgi:hypothetical protein
VKAALEAEAGVATVTSFDTSVATPTAAELAGRDLVVSASEGQHGDPALWGDRLADYIDGGGAVMQTAYDNSNFGTSYPTGRFQSGGYPPLLIGPPDNDPVTLGPVLVPNSPLMQGIVSFASNDNTTTPLAPGATLLALWSDGRNAIATKGRVVAASASIQRAESLPSLARLARNTGNFIRPYQVTVNKTGSGTGTVTSAPGGISCGNDCSESIPFANSVTLTATAGPGSIFLGFSGACAGKAPCTKTIESDLSIGARFASLNALIGSLKFAPSTFNALNKGGSIISRAKKRKRKSGARVSYTLSDDANVTFTVERKGKGRKRGKKCVAKRKKGKRCTKFKRVKGSFTHFGKSGTNSFKFSGRIAGKKLKTGSYRMTGLPTIASSKGKTVRANFKIVR